jgi:hypothetical protein
MEVRDELATHTSIWNKIKNGVFDTFVGMLKDRKVGYLTPMVVLKLQCL